MACIYLLNSRGGTQSFDFDITYFYPIIVTPYLNEDIFKKTMFLAVETEFQDASSNFNLSDMHFTAPAYPSQQKSRVETKKVPSCNTICNSV